MTARARGIRKGNRSDDAEASALLELLSHGLSEDEIRRVVACALLALDEQGRDRLFARVGNETGTTLRRLLASRGRGRTKAPPSPGGAKVRQEWEKAWDEWQACVAESDDEDGRYVVREHHWEEPYLDGYSLVQDLEPIAARMRGMLERVMDEELDPDFSFLAAVQEMDRDIGSGLPDWMDPSSGDGCALGPEATGCLLEWEWRACRRDGRSAFDLADAIRKLEASARIVSLNDDAVAKFMLGLADADQKTVLDGIVAHRGASHWAEVLGAAHSGWFKIHQRLAKRWDPALFEETSRKNIAQDWQLALPLITDLLRRKSFDKALPLIGEALRARLHLETGETWDPRATLFIGHPAVRHWTDGRAEAYRLLEDWQRVVTGLDQAEMASALDLQLAVGRKWADGDAVLKAFQQVPARFAGFRDRLFADWRTLIVQGDPRTWPRRPRSSRVGVGPRPGGRRPRRERWRAVIPSSREAVARGHDPHAGDLSTVPSRARNANPRSRHRFRAPQDVSNAPPAAVQAIGGGSHPPRIAAPLDRGAGSRRPVSGDDRVLETPRGRSGPRPRTRRRVELR